MCNHRKSPNSPRRSKAGPEARSLTISLYARHCQILAERVRELNVSRSMIVQVLVEVDEREGLLRRELIARLQPSETRETLSRN